jgi:hypothetical protein
MQLLDLHEVRCVATRRPRSNLSPVPLHPNPNPLNLTGYLLVYPKREDVHFLADSEAKLKQYYFGQKRKPHLFCGECSSNVMIDFAESEAEVEREVLAVNVSAAILWDILKRCARAKADRLLC